MGAGSLVSGAKGWPSSDAKAVLGRAGAARIKKLIDGRHGSGGMCLFLVGWNGSAVLAFAVACPMIARALARVDLPSRRFPSRPACGLRRGLRVQEGTRG